MPFAESQDLQGDWKIYVYLGHQSAEDSAHLLEAHGDFAVSLLAGIGDDKKCGERISIHCGSPAKAEGRLQKVTNSEIPTKNRVERSRPERTLMVVTPSSVADISYTSGGASQCTPKPVPGIRRMITPSAVRTAT